MNPNRSSSTTNLLESVRHAFRPFASRRFKVSLNTVSSPSNKDQTKRMSAVCDMPEMKTPPISHAASMPTLSCNGCLQHRQEAEKLRLETAALRKELKSTKQALEISRKSEQTLRDRLASEARKQIKLSEKFEDVSLGNDRPTALIQQYGSLYSQTRLDALDSLDSIGQLENLEKLKSKLLFSVVVLSFRQCQQKVRELREKVSSTLGIRKDKNFTNEMETANKMVTDTVSTYLKQSIGWYDITPLTKEVQSQIYSTLYDYPCLKECGRLRHYIEECVTVAWKLSVQNPPCKLEFDCQQFKPDRHVRFHSSNGDSETVRQYIWPALLDSKTGTCYQKGVVIT